MTCLFFIDLKLEHAKSMSIYAMTADGVYLYFAMIQTRGPAPMDRGGRKMFQARD
jgi:hypothetical protein